MKRLAILTAALVSPMLSVAAEEDHMSIGWYDKDKAYSDEDGYDRFSSIELIERDLTNFMPCLKYKIHGASQYMHCTLLKGCYTYWTLNVSHTSPDNLFMTHFQLDEIPLSELKFAFGRSYKIVSEQIFKKPSSLLIGKHVNTAGEIGGGRYKKQYYAQRQAPNMYESTVVGNPSALIFLMFDKDGLKKAHRNDGTKHSPPTACETPGCLEDAYGSGGSRPDKPPQEAIQDWTTGSLADYFDIVGLLKTIAGNPVIQEIQALISAVIVQAETIAAAIGVKLELGSTVFCRNNPRPFRPYYLSGLDAHGWRWGYPFTDARHSTTILNPLSGDTVGGEFIVPPSRYPVTQNFGHIFPREGTVNQQQTSKACMVVTKRAQNLILTNPEDRVIVDPNNYRSGDWSRTFPPLPNYGCKRNIAYTGLNEHVQAKYAWTEWSKYRCDLVSRGWKIAFIPFPWSF